MQIYKFFSTLSICSGILCLLISGNTNDYSTIKIDSLVERSDELRKVRDKIIGNVYDSTYDCSCCRMPVVDDSYFIQFFRLLPDNFETLYKIGILLIGNYDDRINFNPYTKNINKEKEYFKTEYFFINYCTLWSKMSELIPKKIYFNKILNLGMGGFWGSEVTYALSYEIKRLLAVDIKLFVRILQKYNDDEIASLWYFIFDEPHPEYNKKKKEFEDLYCKLYKHSPRIAKQMKRATNYLICHKENRCPNH
jgi:hypothetical protein